MVTQGIFKAHGEYVAVKRFRLNDMEMLKPGDEIKDFNLRLFHVKSLFNRRIIGVKGSDWANLMISNAKTGSSIKPEIRSNTEEVKPKKAIKRGRKHKAEVDEESEPEQEDLEKITNPFV